jgi:N-acetylglucosamine-6-sulfatase
VERRSSTPSTSSTSDGVVDAAGYRTALIGKYLGGIKNKTFVPPGWDYWFSTWGGYFRYDANDQGTRRHFGTKASDYRTDVESRKTRMFIGTRVARGKPFFADVAPKVPHHPSTPAPRDRHAYDSLKAPRLPSFNERNVSDKPPGYESCRGSATPRRPR